MAKNRSEAAGALLNDHARLDMISYAYNAMRVPVITQFAVFAPSCVALLTPWVAFLSQGR
jgi:hypothetical protein